MEPKTTPQQNPYSKGKGLEPKPGLAEMAAGEAKSFQSTLTPFLPQDLVGGTIPHIPGTEEEAVWNAASQSCATEKVHYVYTIEDDKLYFLACPSSSLASNPNSWCPLTAALPGNSEHWDKETVYLYEQEGLASALRWDPETGRMQVFLGASRTILPRVQSMDANFVSINPKIADIVPWKNRALMTEKLARATTRMLIFLGIIVNAIIASVLFYNYFSISLIDRQLDLVRAETDRNVDELLVKSLNAMKSDTSRHMFRIQQLLDNMAKDEATLVRYQITDGTRVEWEALIPDSLARNYGNPEGRDREDGRTRVIGRR